MRQVQQSLQITMKYYLLLIDRYFYNYSESGFTGVVKDFAYGCDRLAPVDIQQVFQSVTVRNLP